jgi:hypothetical protein
LEGISKLALNTHPCLICIKVNNNRKALYFNKTLMFKIKKLLRGLTIHSEFEKVIFITSLTTLDIIQDTG